MRRDLDLIREILFAVEANGPGVQLDSLGFHRDRDDDLTIAASGYHVDLMLDAGFVVGQTFGSNGTAYLDWYVARLTHDGADYLDSVRSPEVYRQTKKGLAKVGGSAGLAVVKQLAGSISAQLIGLG
ncbi:DUF2513 domain-containing protein [Rubricoccus marinus]|uniref:DUF2513 domain-containing protein n=1 Tax=Rubricoccus marinus TaxID=716817 RepID=A0A259U245_9BACT|nr:DUF2513 domain-containing protein [Rubricoccus marinus]OZC04016.1 hypothetical protein BSZ36_14110 [Rubricoccus marinus]